jgi:hypothetical protein
MTQDHDFLPIKRLEGIVGCFHHRILDSLTEDAVSIIRPKGKAMPLPLEVSCLVQIPTANLSSKSTPVRQHMGFHNQIGETPKPFTAP